MPSTIMSIPKHRLTLIFSLRSHMLRTGTKICPDADIAALSERGINRIASTPNTVVRKNKVYAVITFGLT